MNVLHVHHDTGFVCIRFAPFSCRHQVAFHILLTTLLCPAYPACRYVGYFWHVLSAGPKPLGSLPKPQTLQLRQISITGLPPGAAEQCVVVLEARPSGSCAASGSKVFVSPALKPSAAGMPGG
jgi:hypothetical protein